MLSSGVLRSRVVEVSSNGWIRCERSFCDHRDGLKGYGVSGGGAILESKGAHLKVAGVGVEVDEVIELSTGEDAPVVAARLLTGTQAGGEFPSCDLRVATTRGTNALLEGKGGRVALLTTRGFEDLLRIRDQRRPDLFEREPKVGKMVFEVVRGVGGRLDRGGNELVPLDEDSVVRAAGEFKSMGIDHVAVSLLHADRNCRHERRVGELLRREGIGKVSLSHEIAPVIRLLPRTETVVANAYLEPVIGAFTDHLKKRLPEVPLSLMTSAGQLKEVSRFRPIDSLLSGPAGGVAGALAIGGGGDLLTFDMGGTSTDVARVSGEAGLRYEQEIGPVRVLAPAVRIETVAAGGGSICQWRNGGLEVGPESAGSTPGPACYGSGGPLTVTDVNLLLGLMDEGKAGIPLDRGAAEDRLGELMEEIGDTAGSRDELLGGLRQIAIEHMAEAMRQVSTRDGYDCRDHTLVAFGGAGPQHACALAGALGMERVLIPGDAGLLSAWGLHRSRHREIAVRQVLAPLKMMKGGLVEELEGEAFDLLGQEGEVVRVLFELRLKGQDSTLEVEGVERVAEKFEVQYEAVYGFGIPEGRMIELVAVRVEVAAPGESGPEEAFEEGEVTGEVRIIQDSFATTVVERGWRVREGSLGSLLLEKVGEVGRRVENSPAVQDELFRRRFESIVNEMGVLLKRTALSTNIKERLDYSCALLDARGYLVVNAPHIPVHLGALGLCVRMVSGEREWEEGDVVVVNHPAFGGSHLPDVTVISPVFVDGELCGFVANRAHHAEIGGKTPGSMPPDARCLAEEGIVIPPTLLSEIGDGFWSESRSPNDNQADLAAQVAANRHGVKALKELISQSSVENVSARMEGLYRRSSELLEMSKGEGVYEARDVLDDGTVIAVRVEWGDRLRVDFSGSGGVHPRNLNATPAIVRSAVLYVLRLWVGEDIPLNEGLLEECEIIIPEGVLNPPLSVNPEECPAVVGGNVETSQRVVDVLLEALGMQANGQGTMNNLLFGNEHFGFYETLGGGGGAGPGWGGRSGAHVHMSNTAVTDPEVLEARYPVRIREFALRSGSGGEGAFPGGDGLVREIEFLEGMTVSLLTQRRDTAPRGMGGGGDGLAGKQWLKRNGEVEWKALKNITVIEVNLGDALRLETPGGGGWGKRITS
ncbi:MAG: hydantoinase B/oxoprolinase family protein [Verrucomicrobiaceae bacterium]